MSDIFEELSVATEAIDFQGDGFFKDLLADLATVPRQERLRSKKDVWEKLEYRLEKTVTEQTGLNIDFDLSPDGLASIMTPIVDWSHVFNLNVVDAVENTDEAVKFIKKAKEEMVACVDLKKNKITGSLAKELKASIQINREILYRGFMGIEFTDEEVVSLILHEIGHFFTMIEFLDRSVATNQVLAELQRDLLQQNDPGKRTTIIRAAGKELNLDRNVTASVEEADNTTVTTVLLSAGMKNLRSQSGHTFYDMNTWEMLADQYASRNGAGSVLFSAMHKLVQWNPDMTMRSRASFYYRQVATFGSGLLMLVGGMVIAVATPAILIGVVVSILGYVVMVADGRSAAEPVYDNDLGRLTRIRNQQVQAIKQALGKNKSPFTAEYIKQLTKDVEFMDKILKQGADQPTVVQQVIMFFSANETNRQASVKFQKLLEGLAHTDLYAKALALKTI